MTWINFALLRKIQSKYLNESYTQTAEKVWNKLALWQLFLKLFFYLDIRNSY